METKKTSKLKVKADGKTKEFKISENAVAFVFTIHGWGNRKVADKSKVETKMDKKMLSATKKLVDSMELKDVYDHIYKTKNWIIGKAVPSFFREGLYLFDIRMVKEVEDYLSKRKEELEEIISKFLSIYPEQIKLAKDLLGDQYKTSDYPSIGYLRNAFGFEYQWIAFDIPKGLPKDIYNAEKEKAEKLWTDAAEQIAMSLREAFRELITHAVEKLTSEKGGKTKIFRDSLTENIVEFIDTFKNRNLTNDKELEELTEKAKKILKGVDADDLRKDEEIRSVVQKGFKEIEKQLGGMIIEKPSRKFNFED